MPGNARLGYLPEVGDFGLAAGSGWPMRAVRIGTFSRYGHAAICEQVNSANLGGSITIVEPMPHGCRRRVARPGEFVWSDVPLDPEQRKTVVDYAVTCIGLPYDWPAIFGFLTRHWRAKLGGSPDDRRGGEALICSEMPVRAYRLVGVDMAPGKVASAVSPGDLRQWLDDRRRAAPRHPPRHGA